jgi:hypothetical protein
MKYFFPPYTKESIEAQYKELSKILHPDKKGGSEEHFKAMSAEKEIALKIGATQKKAGHVINTGKKIGMLKRRKRIRPQNINFVIDPDKLFKLIKKHIR